MNDIMHLLTTDEKHNHFDSTLADTSSTVKCVFPLSPGISKRSSEEEIFLKIVLRAPIAQKNQLEWLLHSFCRFSFSGLVPLYFRLSRCSPKELHHLLRTIHSWYTNLISYWSIAKRSSVKIFICHKSFTYSSPSIDFGEFLYNAFVKVTSYFLHNF